MEGDLGIGSKISRQVVFREAQTGNKNPPLLTGPSVKQTISLLSGLHSSDLHQSDPHPSGRFKTHSASNQDASGCVLLKIQHFRFAVH